MTAGCASDRLPNDGLSVENLRLVEDIDGTRSVTGLVRNEGTLARSVQLEISLYDEENQRVGSVQVPVNRVLPDSAKGFDWALDQRAEGARLRMIHH